MTESRLPSTYDWDFLRSWCVWYIDLFLQYGSMDSIAGRKWFYGQEGTREINWKAVRSLDAQAATFELSSAR